LPDREIAAAIVASDVNGVAAAFDRYAQELYVYSRSRLAVPAEAAGAVQDTFLVAWSEVRRLHQPGRLRPWLFAVARNECHRLLRTGMRAAPAGAMDDTVQLATLTEQAELRAMVAAALAGLDPMEREIGELNLRHGLRGADLAAVLGVPAKQADALAARARADLESSLRTPPTVGSALQPSLAGLLGMLVVPTLPNGMRDRIVALAADPSPDAAAHRARVAEQAGPFGVDGFPVQLAKLAKPRWRGGPMLAAAAAAAALALLGGGMYYANYASPSSSPQPSAAATVPASTSIPSSGSARSKRSRTAASARKRHATTPLLPAPVLSAAPTHSATPTHSAAPTHSATPSHSATPTHSPTPTHSATPTPTPTTPTPTPTSSAPTSPAAG
jgi:RNA polymerase sigma factor (sigma-70 family)